MTSAPAVTSVLDDVGTATTRIEAASRVAGMVSARLVFCCVIVLQFRMYHPPAGSTIPFDPDTRAGLLCLPLLVSVAASVLANQHGSPRSVIIVVDRIGLVGDVITCWGLIWSFNFDHQSNLWALLAVIVVEGAFQGDMVGALGILAASSAFYALREEEATGWNVDVASCSYRLAIVGSVALLAGLLARQRRSVLREVESRDKDLITIARVSRALALAPDARRAVVEGVAEVLGAAAVSLLELDDAGTSLVTTAKFGIGPDRLTIPLTGPTVSGLRTAFESGRPLFVPDIATASGMNPALVAQYGTRSAWHVPIVKDGRSIALLGTTFETTLSRPPARMVDALRILVEDATLAIERADTAARLTRAARTDPLTGLLNRRGWAEQLEIEMARSTRTGERLCLVLVDLDHFKAYNDTHGHAAGDDLLRTLAEGWRREARITDVIARLGGDEFAMALPGLSPADAERRVTQLLGLVEPGPVGASAGLTIWQRGESLEVAMHRADESLYAAKEAGRGQVAVDVDVATP